MRLGFAALVDSGDAGSKAVAPVVPEGMPQPGEALLRRRTKGPALVRTSTSVPLVPVAEPEPLVDKAPEDVVPPVNPHSQLALLVVWQHPMGRCWNHA